jgi:hypothetical protein
MINKNSERMGKMNALLWEEFEDRKGGRYGIVLSLTCCRLRHFQVG